MAHFALQFGSTQPNIRYQERATVNGLCVGPGGKLAIVQIGQKAPFQYDLPGGGIEEGESDAEALIREFEEETGLTVWPMSTLGRAGQFWVNGDKATNSLTTFFEVELTANEGRPSEPDHELVWMTVEEAAQKVRHDSHAWMILSWYRQQQRASGNL